MSVASNVDLLTECGEKIVFIWHVVAMGVVLTTVPH